MAPILSKALALDTITPATEQGRLLEGRIGWTSIVPAGDDV